MPYSISTPRLVEPILTGSMRLADDNTQHDLLAIERIENAVETSHDATAQRCNDANEINVRNIGNDGVLAHVSSPGCTCWKFPHTTTLPFLRCVPSPMGFSDHHYLPWKYFNLPQV